MQNLQGHSAYSPSNFNSPSSIGPATGMVRANMDQRFILDTAKQFMYGLAGAAGGDALGSVYDKVMFENNKATGYQYPSGYSQRTDAMQSGLSQEEIDAAAQRDDKMIQKDITVAEIRAAGYGSMADINQNQQSDFRDAMKEIRETEQYQSQTDLQRQKQSDDMVKHSQKMNIEQEKLQVQQDIANKQLEIARVNKNKYDAKSSDKKKK